MSRATRQIFAESDLMPAVAWHFRCVVCGLDRVVLPTTTAPVCCGAFMAPVNVKGRASARGEA